MSLKNKFLLLFISISIIPIFIITLFVYGRYTDLINKQTIQITNNLVDSSVKTAQTRLQDLNRMTEIFQLYSNSSYAVLEDIKKYSKKGQYNSYDLFVSRNNMRFLCQHLIYSNDYVNGVFIFTPSGENIGYGWGNGIDIQYGYTPFDDSWYQKTLELKGDVYISNLDKKSFILNSKTSISFSRALYDVDTKDFLGVLLIDCSPNVLDLTNANTLPDYALLSVEKENGTVLYSNVDDINESFFKNQTDKNILIRKNAIEDSGLFVIAAINLNPLYEEFNYTKFLIWGTAVSCAFVFIIISIILSRSLTRPITTLSEIMRNHHNHELVTTDKYLNLRDEIGVLYNEYNNMVEENNQFIKEQYQNKLITLDSQMKSLEAQINSHFLYNTLESINSIAELEEVERISVMSLALGNMFRYSIKTESELVTLRDEINHIENYMAIQKIRFENRFTIHYQIADSMYDLKVLKLILQPVVENALYHGLNNCLIPGTITISANIQNNVLLIELTDNGIGIPQMQLEQIQNALQSPVEITELGRREKQSIGLKNIHSRISLYYGLGYGMSISSELDSGTTITLKLPVIN